jgi:two-component sensor histidine kinase
MGSERIALDLRSLEVLLPINTAIPCGLIVNEIIANSLKHAFPDDRRGKITIDLAHREPGSVRLSVSDDGIGIPDSKNLEDPTTLGMQLVTMLVDQLGGTLTIHRSNPTTFEIRFPLENP